MSRITELVSELRNTEQTASELTEHANTLRKLIMGEMVNEGLTQIKTADATVSRAKRKTYQISPLEWRAWAEKQPDMEVDNFYVTSLDKDRVKAHAERWIRETGEVIPGVTAGEIEYLSIRKATK